MKPADFPQANRTYTKPPDMTDEECSPLRVYDTGEALVSCWQFSWRERLAVLFRGRAWLWVIGRGQPPVALEVESPFSPCEEGR
jgi:hypothetical protein